MAGEEVPLKPEQAFLSTVWRFSQLPSFRRLNALLDAKRVTEANLALINVLIEHMEPVAEAEARQAEEAARLRKLAQQEDGK
jgi:hypothetical protein